MKISANYSLSPYTYSNYFPCKLPPEHITSMVSLIPVKPPPKHLRFNHFILHHRRHQFAREPQGKCIFLPGSFISQYFHRQYQLFALEYMVGVASTLLYPQLTLANNIASGKRGQATRGPELSRVEVVGKSPPRRLLKDNMRL